MEKRIYSYPLESNVDIISYSDKSHVLREQWLLFDSSVFISLTNFFVDRTPLKNLAKADFVDLVTYLSVANINIHPLSLIEASRERKSGNFNEKRWLDHLLAALIAQCIDLQTSTFETLENWRISENSKNRILSSYSKLYQTKSLDQLAVHIFRELIQKADQFVEQVNNFNSTMVIPFLNAAMVANSYSGSNLEKIKLFFAQIANLPHCPKIVDYCLRLFYESHKEPLLTGALGKIKSELERTAWDIALVELAQLANFLEPFEDLKPYVTFYTSDNNQYYFAKLGHPLIIKLDKYSRIYYPDLSYVRDDEKSLSVIKEYFDSRFSEDPELIKDHVLQNLKEDLQGYDSNDSVREFLENIKQLDFSEFSIYKHYHCCPTKVN